MVVGVGRIGKGREEEGIDSGLAEELQSGRDLLQSRDVVIEDVMAQNKSGIFGKGIKVPESIRVEFPPIRDRKRLLA